MRIVDHEGGAVGPADGEEFRHQRERAVHGEQPIGDDEGVTVVPAEQLVHVRWVAVAVDADRGTRRLGEAAAVDNAGVVALVREDERAGSGECLQHSGVGKKPCGEEDRVLVAQETGEVGLDLGVQVGRAGGEARAPGAGSVAADGGRSRLRDHRVPRQPEVIRGTEKHVLAPVHGADRILTSGKNRRDAFETHAAPLAERLAGGGVEPAHSVSPTRTGVCSR